MKTDERWVQLFLGIILGGSLVMSFETITDLSSTITMQDTLQSVTLLVTFGAAIAAWLSAKAAASSAEFSSRTSQAQLVKSFIEEYASTQMHSDLHVLTEFAAKPDAVHDVEFGVREMPSEVNHARRRVKLFFYKAYTLYRAEFMTKHSLSICSNVAALELLEELVMPLTRGVAVSPAAMAEDERWAKELVTIFRNDH